MPELDGMMDTGFFKDLASSIPGIDEAMSFAEMIKQVERSNFSDNFYIQIKSYIRYQYLNNM